MYVQPEMEAAGAHERDGETWSYIVSLACSAPALWACLADESVRPILRFVLAFVVCVLASICVSLPSPAWPVQPLPRVRKGGSNPSYLGLPLPNLGLPCFLSVPLHIGCTSPSTPRLPPSSSSAARCSSSPAPSPCSPCPFRRGCRGSRGLPCTRATCWRRPLCCSSRSPSRRGASASLPQAQTRYCPKPPHRTGPAGPSAWPPRRVAVACPRFASGAAPQNRSVTARRI